MTRPAATDPLGEGSLRRPSPGPRFFTPAASLARDGRTVRCDGGQAHHALHVLRLTVGDAVELFDGQGHTARGTITATGRSEFCVELVGPWLCDVSTEWPGQLTVVTALPKGRRLDTLLEKATELGATEVAALLAERSVRSAARDDHWGTPATQAVCIAAAQQCRRNCLPRLGRVVTVRELAAWPVEVGHLRFVATPGAPMTAQRAPGHGHGRPPLREITIIIGPEGGLCDDEQTALAAAGWQPLGLAPAILRIETAVAAALACTGPWLGPAAFSSSAICPTC